SGARAHGTGVGHVVESGDDDSRAGVEGIHDLPVADVHADVTDRAVVEDQVTGLELALGDVPTRIVLRCGAVRQAHAGLAPRHHGQARAVERARPGGAV